MSGRSFERLPLLSERQAALKGPRTLKDPWSVEWAWQTASYLKKLFAMKEASLQSWDRAIKEAEEYRIYERIPPEAPYGSLDAMLLAEVGKTRAQSREDIIRAEAAREEAAQRGPGNPTGHNQHTGGTCNNVQDSSAPAPVGNSRARALRRLRQQRPDLHARVLGGELSPHAAALEAGFRQRTITVPCDAAGAARALLRHFSGEQVAELVALLAVARDKDGVS